MFELILISQLHPYEKYREKSKNTDWIFKQRLEKRGERRKEMNKGHLYFETFEK